MEPIKFTTKGKNIEREKSQLQYIVKTNEPFRGICQTIISDGKIAYFNGGNFAEYQKAHFPDTFEIWDEEKFNTHLEIFLDSLCNHWHEISKEEYWDMLECLPPMRFDGNSFFMSELTTYNVSSFFCKYDGKYYTSQQKVTARKKEIFSRLITAIGQNKINRE